MERTQIPLTENDVELLCAIVRNKLAEIDRCHVLSSALRGLDRRLTQAHKGIQGRKRKAAKLAAEYEARRAQNGGA